MHCNFVVGQSFLFYGFKNARVTGKNKLFILMLDNFNMVKGSFFSCSVITKFTLVIFNYIRMISGIVIIFSAASILSTSVSSSLTFFLYSSKDVIASTSSLPSTFILVFPPSTSKELAATLTWLLLLLDCFESLESVSPPHLR